jgi:hypothetical protein
MPHHPAQADNPFHEIVHDFRNLSCLNPREFLIAFRQTLNEWSSDKAPRPGASLALYTLLFPIDPSTKRLIRDAEGPD